MEGSGCGHAAAHRPLRSSRLGGRTATDGAWFLLQAAGGHHPGRPAAGAGAAGHSEGMGPDMAQALRGA